VNDILLFHHKCKLGFDGSRKGTILMGSLRSKWLEGMFEDRSMNNTWIATKP